MTLPAGVIRSQQRLDKPEDLAAFYQQQAAHLERLQNGGVNMAGLRVQLRTAAPVDAPAANQPNLTFVIGSGGPHLYVYVEGTGWVAMAQTALPAPHDLVGAEHTASGLTAGYTVVAQTATTFAWAQLAFANLSGSIADGQVPSSAVTQHQAALSIQETQIPDGSLLARVADAETITAAWAFSKAVGMTGIGSDGRITFSGTAGGGSEGIVYRDAAGSTRLALVFPGSDIVALVNRASNGVVQIRANTSTAGSGGEVVVGIFEDTQVTFGTVAGTGAYPVFMAALTATTGTFSNLVTITRTSEQMRLAYDGARYASFVVGTTALVYTMTYGTLDVNQSAAGVRFNASMTEAASGTHPILATVQINAPAITAGAAAVTTAVSLYIPSGPIAGVSNYGLWVVPPSLFNGLLNIQLTSEQLRLSYDASNYLSIIADSTGLTQNWVSSQAIMQYQINGSLVMQYESATYKIFDLVTGTAYGAIHVDPSGNVFFIGAGAGVGDVEVSTAGSNGVTIAASGNGLGFYGTTPVAQASAITKPSGGSTVDSEARTAIDALIDALGASSGVGLTA